MDTHEVLVAARNLIDREGWGGGGPESDVRPGYCVGDALAVAAGATSTTERALWIHLPHRGPVAFHEATATALRIIGYSGSLWCWNDFHCEGAEHAKAVLNEAIAETAPPPADPFIAGPVGRASFREPVA